MTQRTCPWCGGTIRIKNVMASDGSVHWEDRECGYGEVTTQDQRFDYTLNKLVEQEVKVLRFHRPKPPLPENQLPFYLRRKLGAAP